MKGIAVVCAGLLAASAGSAFAQDLDTSREPAEMRISAEGYSFRDAASVARFQQRLWRAAVSVCTSDGGDLASVNVDRRCVRAAYAEAVQQTARMLKAENQDTTLLLAQR